MLKKQFILLALLCLTVAVLSGCRLSKAEYEKQVGALLRDAKKKIERIDQELKQEVRPTCLPTLKQQLERNKKIETIITRLDEELHKLEPPEEYEEGHQALIDEIDLTIDALKLSQRIVQGKRDNKAVGALESKLDKMGRKLEYYIEKVDKKLPFTRSILQSTR